MNGTHVGDAVDYGSRSRSRSFPMSTFMMTPYLDPFCMHTCRSRRTFSITWRQPPLTPFISRPSPGGASPRNSSSISSSVITTVDVVNIKRSIVLRRRHDFPLESSLHMSPVAGAFSPARLCAIPVYKSTGDTWWSAWGHRE